MNTTTNTHIDRSERNVGIDIGKCTLDVCIFELELYLQYSNTTEGIRELLKKLSRYHLTRILVEATGGYERHLVEACAEKELPVIIVQPTQVRQFAKTQGVIAKTDKLDSRLIAQFGAIMKPEVRPIQLSECLTTRKTYGIKGAKKLTRGTDLLYLVKFMQINLPLNPPLANELYAGTEKDFLTSTASKLCFEIIGTSVSHLKSVKPKSLIIIVNKTSGHFHLNR